MYRYTPDIRGMLTLNGKPLSSQLVVLRVGVRGTIHEFQTLTDASGAFAFPAFEERNPQGTLSLNQKYVLVFLKTHLANGEEVTIWESSIDGYETYEFARENMGDLNCEVTNEVYYFAFSYSGNGEDDTYVYSQCKLTGYVDSGIYEE
ncbi:hypothetical protein DA096_10165 [Vibrio rotiferianus]|uniref:DUF6795 domain-containing protein n=1 Tax=Vibrio rotiferianus TaxID=190895 RepID=UPI001110D9B3|nr:DUF6795 domain-containing protein [Vibrio rotiferianus]TMX48273.1 hypothetical protein DA093_17120 [Vibrio rotiferianus]TMX64123.1 hypothetical protein DA096_10165 [Vibrio rotiferianus]